MWLLYMYAGMWMVRVAIVHVCRYVDGTCGYCTCMHVCGWYVWLLYMYVGMWMIRVAIVHVCRYVDDTCGYCTCM